MSAKRARSAKPSKPKATKRTLRTKRAVAKIPPRRTKKAVPAKVTRSKTVARKAPVRATRKGLKARLDPEDQPTRLALKEIQSEKKLPLVPPAIPAPAPKPELKVEPTKPTKAPPAHEEKMSKTQPLPTVKARPTKAVPAPKLPFPVPPILLTGDEPYVPPPGPGHKFAVRGQSHPQTNLTPSQPQFSSLPEAYGSGRVTATARDPRTIYVHWDFTFEQQQRFNQIAGDGAMTLRMRWNSIDGDIAATMRLHADSRHWFAHVPESNRTYVAELGYWQRDGGWVRVGSSERVQTPGDQPAKAGAEEVRFARVPDLPTPHRESAQKEPFRQEGPPPSPRQDTTPAHTRAWDVPIRRSDTPAIHAPAKLEYVPGPPPWTAKQERILAEMISEVVTRTDWFGSVELVEMLRRRVEQELLSPPGPLEVSLPSSAELLPSSIHAAEQLPSSQAVPAQPGQPQRSFWFNVNAELIIYGATEPDAQVTIGGRPIRLRPDGTFSYRFALPDGEYKLPAAATSRDGETRGADLRFSRATVYSGDVGKHPQDPALKIPAPENTF